MNASNFIRFIFVCLVSFSLCAAGAAEPFKVINLWPDTAPGDKGTLPVEKDMTKPEDRPVAGKSVVRLGNVSKPTISIYRPVKTNSGAAVLVCPGGAYNIVAFDLEGSEICEWFNSIGVTAVLLKYRVPRREGLEKHTAPLQDAQRALGLIRQNAKDWGIDPNRIGVLGFSAGGHLAATLTAQNKERTYPKVDAADEASCRPDFTMLVYPAYLTVKDDLMQLSPEVKPTSSNPQTFIAMTEDDGVHVECALAYYLALKQAKVPAEMHLYPNGGHGYGLRPSENTVSTWPARAAEWLGNRKILFGAVK